VISAAGDVSITGDIVAVRSGGTVILLVNAALQLDAGLTEALAQEAYAQVVARW
jgi:hypothetical protein